MRKTIDKRILQEAEQEASMLIKTSKKKSDELKKAGLEQITAMVAQKLESAKLASDKLVAAHKNRQEKNLITYQEQIKQEIVVGVFDGVLAKISSLTGNELLSFVLHLISKEKVTGEETIQVANRNHAKYLAAFSSKKDPANLDLLNGNNKKYKFKLTKGNVPIREGFLLNNPTFDLIFDFNEIVRKYQDKHEQEVYGELFKNE